MKVEIDKYKLELACDLLTVLNTYRNYDEDEELGIVKNRYYKDNQHITLNKKGMDVLRFLPYVLKAVALKNEIQLVEITEVEEENVEPKEELAEFKTRLELLSPSSLPKGLKTVTEFCKWINIYKEHNCKSLTAIALNRKLKELGVLGERIKPDGKMEVWLNERSEKFGFEKEIRKTEDGREYEVVVMNSQGMEFLIKLYSDAF